MRVQRESFTGQSCGSTVPFRQKCPPGHASLTVTSRQKLPPGQWTGLLAPGHINFAGKWDGSNRGMDWEGLQHFPLSWHNGGEFFYQI